MLTVVGIASAVGAGVLHGYAKHMVRDMKAAMRKHYAALRERKISLGWAALPYETSDKENLLAGQAIVLNVAALIVFVFGCIL